MSESWRLLLTGPGDPGFNMAFDEALALSVRRGWSPPTLRIYRWSSPAISLGCHQPVSVLEGFQRSARAEPVEAPVAIVRRPTGGGAVAHADDVSYALVCDAPSLRGRPSRTLYPQFHAALGEALQPFVLSSSKHERAVRPSTGSGRTGYRLYEGRAQALPDRAICFEQPIADDLMLGLRKVAGAAQRRWRDGLLQQGTVAAPGCSPDRVALGIRTAWAEVFHCRFTVGAPTAQERVLADELWSKYRSAVPDLPWPRGAGLASGARREERGGLMKEVRERRATPRRAASPAPPRGWRRHPGGAGVAPPRRTT